MRTTANVGRFPPIPLLLEPLAELEELLALLLAEELLADELLALLLLAEELLAAVGEHFVIARRRARPSDQFRKIVVHGVWV